MVILNVTNLIGGRHGGVDYGEANLTIGATNGSLTISNVVPATFQRVRGDIYASRPLGENTQTNDVTAINAPITNPWHYHVLVWTRTCSAVSHDGAES